MFSLPKAAVSSDAMPGRMTRLGVLVLLWRTTWAMNCSIEPLYVDLHYRAVSGKDEKQYGSFVGVGTPPTNHTLWPSFRQNETSFASNSFCANSNLKDCSNIDGGVFDPDESSSWSSENNGQATNASRNTFVEGKDVLSLYTHYFLSDPDTSKEINDVPVMVAQTGSTRPGILGIGSASTILNTLFDAGLIAARTYSLYIGTGFARAGGDAIGSNVFGGYDSGRFEKPVYTYDLNYRSPDYLSVNVSDVIIDDFSDPTKQRLSLMGDETFKAQITTDQYPMRLPFEITRRFIAAMGAVPANNGDNSLKLNRPFNGSMTIFISGGFNVTFSPEALFNASGLSPIENTPRNYTGPFYLSTAWLTQVYLSLDFHADQFHVARAIPHAPYIIPRPLCPGSFPVAYSYSGPEVSFFNRNGLIGAIIGGVVGGIAVLMLCCVLFVLWRRRRQVRAQEERFVAEAKAMTLTNPPKTAPGESPGDMEMRRLSRHADMLTPKPALIPPPITTVKSFGVVQQAIEIVHDDSEEDLRSHSPVSSLGSRRSSRASTVSRPRSLIISKP